MELNNLESAFDLQELLGSENDGSGSISRGVFAYKGFVEKRKETEIECHTPTKRKQSNKKKVTRSPRKKCKQMQSDDDEAQIREFKLFSAASNERGNDASEQHRLKNYLKTERKATQIMQNLQNVNYARTIGHVIEFIEKSKKVLKEKSAKNLIAEESKTSNFLFKESIQASEIPTAALLTGINVPDHANFYQLLTKEIKSKKVSAHVASIKAKECGSNLRQLMKVIVKQLLGICNRTDKYDTSDSETDDEKENSLQNSKNVSARHSASIASLRLWYENQYPSFQSECERPPLIIVFEDFESFAPRMLQELIRNLSLISDQFCGVNHKKDGLPFVLIFGIATTVDIIHRTLPNSVTSQLAIEKFAAEPSSNLMAKVAEQILIKNSTIPFKLAGKPLKHLIETFYFNDFSVKHFFMAYKCCLLEHYSQNFAAILCCETDDEIESIVQSMTKNDIDRFRSMPSFINYLQTDTKDDIKIEIKEEIEFNKQDTLISEPKPRNKYQSDKDFRKFIVNKILELKTATETFNIFVDALFNIFADVPNQPLGKHYHSVYSNAMKSSVHQQEYYRLSFSYLNLCEKAGMLKHLNKFVSGLKQFPHNKEASEAVLIAEKIIKDLENLDQMNHSKKVEKVEETNTISPISVKTPKGKLDRSKWQEQLRELAKEKEREKCRQKLNPFETIRKRVNDFYYAIFSRILSHDDNPDLLSYYPLNKVFHEVFYLTDNKRNCHNKRLGTTFMEDRLHGAPRHALKKALEEPDVYLKSYPQLDSKSEKYDVSFLPDLCIAYKLYKENSRYINLFDWLNCWMSLVTNGAEEYAPDSKNKIQVDPKYQARFGRCVSELQFLGFIRPSKRKTDHVEKLTD